LIYLYFRRTGVDSNNNQKAQPTSPDGSFLISAITASWRVPQIESRPGAFKLFFRAAFCYLFWYSFFSVTFSSWATKSAKEKLRELPSLSNRFAVSVYIYTFEKYM